MRIYLSTGMSDNARREVEGKSVRFFVPWSSDERSGVITRVSFACTWIGAFCFSHHHLLDLREQTR